MSKYLNKPLVIIILLALFFALTLMVSYRYSNNEEGREKIRQSIWYRGADWGVKQGEKIFGTSPKETESATTTESGNIDNEPQGLKEKFKKYIRLERDEEGLTLILENSEGIFWERTWRLFPKSTENSSVESDSIENNSGESSLGENNNENGE